MDFLTPYAIMMNLSIILIHQLQHQRKKKFQELDKDNDGFLTENELVPVIGNLHPSERYYARQQADYVLSQADADKDGRLSLHEMIEHPYVFYSAIFNDDDDDDFVYHDEFR
ncbi:hypothetical protein HPP92_022907 [Vanilla planifolia]|uniref:EF-hand domain-containing protein n=1 Tax=Vanilla planifolia TaxID=51239 RepID=A0A835UE26_VANPL|nr:hypothetical protein HPP92_022907 [Vanilla planifolia]